MKLDAHKKKATSRWKRKHGIIDSKPKENLTINPQPNRFNDEEDFTSDIDELQRELEEQEIFAMVNMKVKEMLKNDNSTNLKVQNAIEGLTDFRESVGSSLKFSNTQSLVETISLIEQQEKFDSLEEKQTPRILTKSKPDDIQEWLDYLL